MPQIICMDVETYSFAPLPKCGVYRYADVSDFEILLFSYASNDDPAITVDLACGEKLPETMLAALENPGILKYAFNTQLERVCLSKHLGRQLDPLSWHCTAVMASYLTLPSRLADVAVALFRLMNIRYPIDAKGNGGHRTPNETRRYKAANRPLSETMISTMVFC